jgi:hypothetical protein
MSKNLETAKKLLETVIALLELEEPQAQQPVQMTAVNADQNGAMPRRNLLSQMAGPLPAQAPKGHRVDSNINGKAVDDYVTVSDVPGSMLCSCQGPIGEHAEDKNYPIQAGQAYPRIACDGTRCFIR